MITPIRLETERLILRTPLENDFEAAVTGFMTSDRTTFVGGPITDPWHQWQTFMATAGHWAFKGYGFFTVCLKDETPIGRVGVINHVMWPEPELGWHVFDGYEGKGYVTEAAFAARDWAWRERGLGPLISQIHPDNHGSIRVAERMGAVLETEREMFGEPCLVYRHPKQELVA